MIHREQNIEREKGVCVHKRERERETEREKGRVREHIIVKGLFSRDFHISSR